MATITIVDESLAGEKSTWNLDFLDETMSLRELLRRRAFQEVTEYHARIAWYVVQPTQAERTLNGSHLPTAPKLDWQAHYEKVLEAFTRQSYLVLVNDRQITDLDMVLTLHAGTEVTFLKLVPLVGG